MDKLFLGAIFTYLGERVPATISPVTGEPSLRLYTSYVNFHRKRFAFTVHVDGHLAEVAAVPVDVSSPLVDGPTKLNVDLQHPSSLQQIYEFTMGKQFR